MGYLGLALKCAVRFVCDILSLVWHLNNVENEYFASHHMGSNDVPLSIIVMLRGILERKI